MKKNENVIYINLVSLLTLITFIILLVLSITKINKWKKDNKENIALIAKKLSFYHPTTNELLTFEIDLPKRYPYTLF